jgi:phosphorylcholine metabolism protein LicD
MFVRHHRYFEMMPLVGKEDKALEVLVEGVKHINKPWWISAGTLLGFERNGNFIPYDTDIDIATIGETKLELPSDFELIRTATDYHGRLHQQAYMHNPTNIIFDVFHYYEHDENTYYTESEKGKIFRSRELLDNLTTKTYRGVEMGVPTKIDEYLTEWYGEWRIPKQEKTIWKK